MSEMPLPNSESHSPERISISIEESVDEFYKERGFGTVAQGEFMSITAEKSLLSQREADGDARRRLDEADGDARRRLTLLNFIVKDALVYVVGICLVLGLATISGLMLFNEKASNPEKEWARAMLSAIGGSVAGFVFGKSSQKP
jgi:hypothetical protein